MNLPLKPGHKTSEFWAVVIAGLSLTGLSAFAMLDAEWVAGCVTVLTILYNASRSGLKRVQAQGELETLKTENTIAEMEARADFGSQSPAVMEPSLESDRQLALKLGATPQNADIYARRNQSARDLMSQAFAELPDPITGPDKFVTSGGFSFVRFESGPADRRVVGWELISATGESLGVRMKETPLA